MTEAIATKIIKGGSRTVFVDLKRAKNDALYVTLSALGKNASGDQIRQYITLFGEQAKQTAEALTEILQGQDLSTEAVAAGKSKK